MNGSTIIDHFRNQLTDDIGSTALPRPRPLNIDPYLAMSLMQKAIRRGHEELALGSAATLLQSSPDRFWRRLGIIAFEDIGLGDFDAVAMTTAALGAKRWRATVRGEWAVGATLVRRLCSTLKCRASDDLLVVCEQHPHHEEARLKLTYLPIDDLLKRATSRAELVERALAIWYAVGTARYRSSVLRERRGDPQTVFDLLSERGCPDTVVEVCRTGLTKCGVILPAFLLILWPEYQRSVRHGEPDDIPEDEMIGNIPSWAIDMFTRAGKQAITRFLSVPCETRRWLQEHLPPNERRRVLGDMIFRVEGGLVDRRL